MRRPRRSAAGSPRRRGGWPTASKTRSTWSVDASLNGGGEVDLAAQLDRCMADVHAIEKQGLQLLETGPRVIEDEALKRFFADHLRESEEHEAMVRERIEARGAKPARAADAVLQLTGMQVGAFFAAQPDTTEKLVGFVAAYRAPRDRRL